MSRVFIDSFIFFLLLSTMVSQAVFAGVKYTKIDASGNPLADTASDWRCIRNNFTGQLWEVKTSSNYQNTYNLSEAEEYAGQAADDGLCGSTDWRVPTIQELLTISDKTQSTQALNPDYFPFAGSGYYFSKTQHNQNSDNMWVFAATTGETSDLFKENTALVRLVSGNKLSKSSYTKLDAQGNPPDSDADLACIRDENSGLIWEVKTSDNWGESYSYTDAGNYSQTANASSLCGYNDWRLPDIEELATLVDYEKEQPAIDSEYFPNTLSDSYWSASPHATSSSQAWAVNFGNGRVVAATQSSTYAVRLVRGGNLLVQLDQAYEPGTDAVSVSAGSSVSLNIRDGLELDSNHLLDCPGGTLNGSNYTSGAIEYHCLLKFKPKTYTLTATVSGSGGSVSPSTQSIAYQQSAQFTINTNTDYSIAEVSGNCDGSLSGNVYTISSVTRDCQLSVSFDARPQIVVLSPLNNSSVNETLQIHGTASDDQSGYTIKLTLTNSKGLNLSLPVTINGNEWQTDLGATELESDENYVLTATITDNNGQTRTEQVNFEYLAQPQTIQINGQITYDNVALGGVKLIITDAEGNQSSLITAADGSYQQIINSGYSGTITPEKTGYHFEPASITINNLQEDTAYNFVAIANTYQVQASVSGSGGQVQPASQTIIYQQAAVINLTPDSGYGIGGIEGNCSGSLSENIYRIDAVEADCEIKVSFDRLPEISITSPLDNEVVKDSVAITGTATDDKDNFSVSVKISNDQGLELSLPVVLSGNDWRVDLNSVELDGNIDYTITAEVRDSISQTAVKQVKFRYESSSQLVRISGLIQYNGAPLEGVTLVFTDASNTQSSQTSDTQGAYQQVFNKGYSGTLYPKKSGYTFTPERVVITDLQQDTEYHFTATQVESEQQARAIIVAGGGNFNDPLWNATNTTANFAYRTLLYKGISKDNILYLNFKLDQDVDLDGSYNDIYAIPSTALFQSAINVWAQNYVNSKRPLIIYLLDHGLQDQFFISKDNSKNHTTESIDSQTLDSWLDELQSATNAKVILIYDACFSGSFMEKLKATGDQQRILIFSSGSNELAFFGSRGDLSFSNFFWTNTLKGKNIRDTFLDSRMAIRSATNQAQKPVMDDNNDGVWDSHSDGNLAALSYLGNPLVSAVSEPTVVDATASQSIDKNSSLDVYIELDSSASRVWAVLVPPQTETSNDDQPVVDLPEYTLSYNSQSGRYETTIDNFDQRGLYQLSFYAQTESPSEFTFLLKTIKIATFGQQTDAALDDLENVFEWAERFFPDVFRPAAPPTQEISGYIYRYYPDSQIAIALKDEQIYLYYADQQKLVEVGSLASVLEYMNANPAP